MPYLTSTPPPQKKKKKKKGLTDKKNKSAILKSFTLDKKRIAEFRELQFQYTFLEQIKSKCC